MFRWLRWPRWLLVAGAVFGFAAYAVVVHAAIPDSQGDVHACYKVYSGEMRLIDPALGGACIGDEKPLEWSSSKLLTGSVQPTGSVGDVGDLFIDLTNKVIWGPKTASGWGTGSSLSPGVSGLEPIESTTPLLPNTTSTISMSCPGGKKAMSGGVYVGGDGSFTATTGISVVGSGPIGPNGWVGAMENRSTDTYTMALRILCVNA